MDKKQKITINVLIVAILVVVALGRSYAYMNVSNSGSENTTNIKTSNGEINLTFVDNNVVNIVNPKVSEDPIVSKTFTLVGTNNSNDELWYYLTLVSDENTFDNGVLSYSLVSNNYSNNGTTIKNVIDFPNINGTGNNTFGKGVFTYGKNSVHTYTVNIYNSNTENAKGKYKGHIAITTE